MFDKLNDRQICQNEIIKNKRSGGEGGIEAPCKQVLIMLLRDLVILFLIFMRI